MNIALLLVFFIAAGLTAGSGSAGPVNKEGWINDAKFMEASVLGFDGKSEEAAKIIEDIKYSVNDEYVYVTLSDMYMNSDRPELARSTLKDAVKRFPKSDFLYFKLAQVVGLGFKDFKGSLPYLKKAADIDAKEDYLKTIAKVYANLRMNEKALEAYNTLIEKYPDSEYYYGRSKIYNALGKTDEMEEDLKKAVEINQNLSALTMLAEIYIERNDFDSAAEMLEKVISTRPGLILPEMKLAEVYKKLNDYEKALEIYNSVQNSLQGKERLYVLKQKANIYFNQDKYEQALAVFLNIIKEYPEDLSAYYSAGVIYEAMGDADNAADVYEQALDRRADYTAVIKRLAYIRLRGERFEEAAEMLGKVPETDIDVEYYRLSAAVFSEQENWTMAEAVLKKAQSENPESERILLDLATVYVKQEEFDSAIEILERGLEINPESPEFLNFLGFTYADLDMKLDEAFVMIERALEYKPDNPAYLDSMAWVLYRKERFREAYDYQLRALKMMPEEEEIRQHMRAIMDALSIDKTLDEIIKEN